jgi:hypothetical protein
MSRLDEIRARLDAATPGPWTCEVGGDAVYINAAKTFSVTCLAAHYGDSTILGCGGTGIANGHLIAHAPDDLRLLLDVAEAAQEVSKWRKARDLHSGQLAKLDKALSRLDGDAD